MNSVSSSTKGAIGELKVCAHLLEQGWAVYRAVSPSAPFDLAIAKGDKLLRIEVRTANYLRSGAISAAFSKDTGKFDHYAFVLPDKIVFQPDLDAF
jgi:hypothetical protein